MPKKHDARGPYLFFFLSREEEIRLGSFGFFFVSFSRKFCAVVVFVVVVVVWSSLHSKNLIDQSHS